MAGFALQPLPVRASLLHYDQQAGRLLRSFQAHDPKVVQPIRQHHPRLPGRANTNERSPVTETEIRRIKVSHADARTIVARWHGFDSWKALAKHVTELKPKGSLVLAFERAVEAIVSGDEPALQSLLRRYPQLIRARSTRQHHATLLHYVGANAVEGYHQKTPPNAVKIAKLLLQAGPEVDADLQYDAAIYGERKGSTTLGMVATSCHPAVAGVQKELMEVLLDAGAAINGLAGGWSLVIAALHNGRGDAAQFLAQRGATLDLEGAVGTGSLRRVKHFFTTKEVLKKGLREKELQLGCMWACQYGHRAVVKFLLERGLPVNAQPQGESALHWAAYAGHASIVKLLLKHNASVASIDTAHGGTPLEWALYGWANPPPETKQANYYDVVATLVAAGASLEKEWSQQRGLDKRWKADPRMQAALRGAKTS